jgi:hypothetical protein
VALSLLVGTLPCKATPQRAVRLLTFDFPLPSLDVDVGRLGQLVTRRRYIEAESGGEHNKRTRTAPEGTST